MFSLKNQKFIVFGIFFLNCRLSKKLDNQKCYDTLGCINLTPEWTHPLYRPTNVLPSDRHAVNTIFVLWKIHNHKLLSEIIGTNSLNGTKISLHLKLCIHDFTSNGYTGWIQHLAKTMLSYPDSEQSIISVDWAAGAEPPYIQAIANARLVALEIVHFLQKLKIIFNIKMENVHLIGHGIGAHIAGYVGKITPPKRITALDPSGTFFEHMPPNVHLSREDAEYIEVLHTDVSPSGQGNKELLGHADFFANGGRKQPGCEDTNKFLKTIKRGDLKLGETLKSCSHKRSLKYYIETIINKSCAFIGVACESYKDFLEGKCSSCGDNMESCLRLNTPKPPRLLNNVLGYYFVTSSAPPFCGMIYDPFSMLNLLQPVISPALHYRINFNLLKICIKPLEFFEKKNGEIIKITLYIDSATTDQKYVNGYFNITIKQSIGDVNFLINENSIIAALRTNKQHTFLVFRSTPPPLLLPIKVIFLKWQHKPLPCHWCTSPRITKFMIYKLTDISTNKPQSFCSKNSSFTRVYLERRLQPCKDDARN